MKPILCFAFGLFAVDAVAKPLTIEARQASETGVEGRAGAGIGTFQDIQVPVSELSGLRADGHSVAQEGATHVGIPVYAGLAVTRHNGAVDYQLGLDALRMSATSGPADTRSATYARFDLGAGATYHFTVAGLSAAIGGGAGIRRSVFSNGSNGHYFQAPLLSAQGAVGTRAFNVSLGGSLSPTAAFGYYNGSMFSGDSFKNSKTSLSEIALGSSYLIREDVFLDFGISQETAQVAIADVSEYDGFGLQVSPTSEVSRAINVATTVARLGFRKEF